MGSKPIGISASRGSAILGLNQYQTPLNMWQIIMEEQHPGFNSLSGYILPEPPNNAAIRWGLAFEDAICQLAEKRQEMKIIDREMLFFNDPFSMDKKFISCHIDGQYAKETESKDYGGGYIMSSILHEGKTTWSIPFKKKWGPPETDKIPREYQIQCQHQMLCTGADEVILSVLVFPVSPEKFEDDGWHFHYFEGEGYFIDNDTMSNLVDFDSKPMSWAKPLYQMGFFHQYNVKRNQKLIDMMVEKYTEWWNAYIVKKISPEPINIDDIKRLTPEPVGSIVLPDDIISMYKEYKLIKKETGQSGTLALRARQLKTIILDAARNIEPVIDEESTDKWLFYDRSGSVIGSWGKDKKGFYVFR